MHLYIGIMNLVNTLDGLELSPIGLYISLLGPSVKLTLINEIHDFLFS